MRTAPRTVLWLTQFEPERPKQWTAQRIALFSPSERTRLERIKKPLRREQFIVGHVLLRALLSALGAHNPEIAVTDEGRPYWTGTHEQNPSWYLSLAHSQTAVAALAAQAPKGVDIEHDRTLRDGSGLIRWLTNQAPVFSGAYAHESPSTLALKLWVASEAHIKASNAAPSFPPQSPRPDSTQIAKWILPEAKGPHTPHTPTGYWLAVSGGTPPCQTALFDLGSGTYNSVSLDWQTLTMKPKNAIDVRPEPFYEL